MAEKEERISIELLKDDFCNSCDNRGKLRNCCCYEKQEYDERYQKSIPRQEAIKRMAKAFNSVVTIISQEACLEGIEAALNSLL